jgi:hypothetical protein
MVILTLYDMYWVKKGRGRRWVDSERKVNLERG